MTVATSKLHLIRRLHGNHAIVTAVGAITRHTVIQLRTVLLQALARYNPHLILDVSAVDDIDDAGADALRRTGDRAHLLGGQLRLVAPNQKITRRLRDTGAAWSLSTHPTVQTALEAVAADEPDTTVPVPDWLDQRQPAEPEEIDDAEPVLNGALEADTADVAEQHQPVPADDENGYPHDAG